LFLIALAVGLVMLVAGADLIVRGGGKLALALRVPALVVGLTIVAFGTSAPELAVSMTAAYRASTEMALANVTGSNIANIVLVLGLAAVVSPLRMDRGLIRREVPVCLGLQILVPLMCLDGLIARWEGGVLLASGVTYNTWIVWDALRRRAKLAEGAQRPANHWQWHLLVLLGGILVLVAGAQLFVGGAVEVAQLLGMSDRYIGLTVVALGTSAPEVATSMVSSHRGEAELATGNVLGSNILNITMVLALTALVRPIVIMDQWSLADLLVAVLVTLALIPIVLRDKSVSRVEGGAMAAGYVTYLVLIS
jgi:cation:H+ antiporter